MSTAVAPRTTFTFELVTFDPDPDSFSTAEFGSGLEITVTDEDGAWAVNECTYQVDAHGSPAGCESWIDPDLYADAEDALDEARDRAREAVEIATAEGLIVQVTGDSF